MIELLPVKFFGAVAVKADTNDPLRGSHVRPVVTPGSSPRFVTVLD